MPRFFVTYDRTYTITAEDEQQAIEIAEFEGKMIDMDIFVEELREGYDE